MLRIVTSKRSSILPSPLLELILASSSVSPICRPYHPPPVSPDVKPLSTPDLLSSLSSLIQQKHESFLTDTEAELHNRRISSLRLALGSADPVRLRDAFGDLMEDNSLEALTARDLEMISKILHNHFTCCPSICDVIDGARAIALKVAAKGHLDALRACLVLYLKNGDILGVTSTYDEFTTLFQDPPMPVSEQDALSDHDKEAISDSILISKPVLPRSFNPAVADLIMTVLAAYATQDRFDDAFDRFIVTPMTVRFTAPKTKAFCEAHLAHDLALSSKVQAWIQELVHLRLLSRHTSLQNYVTGLASDKNIASLQEFYSTTISECRKVDSKILVTDRGSIAGGRRRIIVSSAVWDIFLQAFFKCNRTDLAEVLWSDVTGLGLSPNRHMWTTMLVGYGRLGQCSQAMSVWNRMVEAGIEPKQHAYGAMIQAYFGARRPQEGFALFEQYRIQSDKSTEGRQSFRDPSMLPLFNIVLHGLCMNGMDSQAKNVIKDMMDHGPKPDVVSYNTFLRHYGRIGDMKSVASVLRALKPANIQPDIHSFTTLLSALYKGGKRDAHTKLIQIMETIGVRPNVAMYSAIIDFLVRQGGRENFRNATLLLQLMENNPDKGCRPNEITYTGILAGLHRDPTIPAQDVKLYTEGLFAQMSRNGILPNRTTYHYLIKACLENPELQGLQMALGYYREMGKRGLTLTNRTWYVILSSLLRRGDGVSTLVQRVQRKISSNGGQR
ncbi:hypothetical protein JB92DRAFT_2785718 [Gautieria morchelliformis]|nr:hypothetical protein JB92DRAFT_2785718 [Gautieria morchelliformis]